MDSGHDVSVMSGEKPACFVGVRHPAKSVHAAVAAYHDTLGTVIDANRGADRELDVAGTIVFDGGHLFGSGVWRFDIQNLISPLRERKR